MCKKLWFSEFLLGWGEFRFFHLGKGVDGLKVDIPLVDHKKISFLVSDQFLAWLPGFFRKRPRSAKFKFWHF